MIGSCLFIAFVIVVFVGFVIGHFGFMAVKMIVGCRVVIVNIEYFNINDAGFDINIYYYFNNCINYYFMDNLGYDGICLIHIAHHVLDYNISRLTFFFTDSFNSNYDG